MASTKSAVNLITRRGHRFLAIGEKAIVGPRIRMSWAPRNHAFTSPAAVSPEDAKTFLLSTIGDSKVAIFSKTYCPFCDRTKKLFRTLGEDAKILELDLRSDGVMLQDQLAKMTSQRSVPNVFVNGKHIGGNDDTQALARSGKLQEMLKE